MEALLYKERAWGELACPSCLRPTVMVVKVRPAQPQETHDALDVTCSVCSGVVATLLAGKRSYPLYY